MRLQEFQIADSEHVLDTELKQIASFRYDSDLSRYAMLMLVEDRHFGLNPTYAIVRDDLCHRQR